MIDFLKNLDIEHIYTLLVDNPIITFPLFIWIFKKYIDKLFFAEMASNRNRIFKEKEELYNKIFYHCLYLLADEDVIETISNKTNFGSPSKSLIMSDGKHEVPYISRKEFSLLTLKTSMWETYYYTKNSKKIGKKVDKIIFMNSGIKNLSSKEIIIYNFPRFGRIFNSRLGNWILKKYLNDEDKEELCRFLNILNLRRLSKILRKDIKRRK